jgi:endoglucanase
MKQRLSLFAICIISIIAIPSIFKLFSPETLVQSINDSPYAPVVYDNALSENWENWSWNSELQFDSSDNPFQGSSTIHWKAYNWGGLYLHVKNNESIDASRYESLEFSLRGTQDNQKYTVILYDENNQPIGNAKPVNELGGDIPNGTWRTYTVSLTTFNPEKRNIKGIVLQSTKGEDQHLSLDEIRFIPVPGATEQTLTPDSLYIYADSLQSNWENWSWDSSVVMDETSKTNSGTHSLAYTAQAPWAGLYLHAKQNINTSAYKALTLSVLASQPNQTFSIALLDTNNALTGNPLPLSDFGSSLQQDKWNTYQIPLSKLNVKSKGISGIIIQNPKNSSQPTVYIDSIFFSPAAPETTITPTKTTPIITATISPTPKIQATKTTFSASDQANPFANSQLYVNPNNNAQQTVEKWRSQGRTTDANEMEKLAKSPTALWVVGGDPYGRVNEYVTQAYAANALPVIVSYNIPGRDCGQYSQGGATAEGYKSWIKALANAVGDRKAAIILEPDALGLDCLQNDTTYSLMKYAIDTLESHANTSVYVEAATWVDQNIMADRLKKAGLQNAQGFAVNTSGYNTTETMIAFGNTISAKTGKKFVIDTSRNGRGPYDQSQPEPWCNPPDRGLGHKPTTHTGYTNVDAFLWIKVPGESDGNCRGGPSAGNWWEEYALGLAQRAAD